MIRSSFRSWDHLDFAKKNLRSAHDSTISEAWWTKITQKSTEFLSFISKENHQNFQLKEFPTMSRSNPSKSQAKQGLARSKSSLAKGSPNPPANSCDFGARCVMSRVMDKWNSDFLGTFGPEDIMVDISGVLHESLHNSQLLHQMQPTLPHLMQLYLICCLKGNHRFYNLWKNVCSK